MNSDQNFSPLGLGAALHVVAFNVPWPADYGGVVDVFHKLKGLKEAGAVITLHCFQYGRPEAHELEHVCERVHYYRRVTGLRGLSLREPYIVSSRRSKELLDNLKIDDAPILFEGLHCCHYIDHPALTHRFKAVRLHNVEWEYYRYLAQREKHLSIRLYLKTASRRLRLFERRLSKAQLLLPISPRDTAYYQRQHPRVHYLPAFHANDKVTSLQGRGEYVLYHGNLSVNENHEAAMFLLTKVFAERRFKVIIAGKDPRLELTHAASNTSNVLVEANPSDGRMNQLISEAHVHVLTTFQPTGMKLKLLNTLFAGRFVIANTDMVKDTGLESLTLTADDPIDIRDLINQTLEREFTEAEIVKRREALIGFNNKSNAELLLRLLKTD
jgi:hypothetical protein